MGDVPRFGGGVEPVCIEADEAKARIRLREGIGKLAAVFLGQYFQLGRGYSPTIAGLLTLPMVGGSLIFATVSGGLITKFGRWKIFLVTGGILMTIGFALLATINGHTNMLLVGLFLFILGAGMGMTMQNLILPVQNAAPAESLGVATSTVTFFRSLGGAAGVSVLGAVLATHVQDLTGSGLTAMGHARGPARGRPRIILWLEHRDGPRPVSYTHLRAHETVLDLVCRLLLEKKHTYITRDANLSKSLPVVFSGTRRVSDHTE